MTDHTVEDKKSLIHVAYCTGPAQLAYLISSLEIFGIRPNDCTLILNPGAANDELRRYLLKICNELKMDVTDLAKYPQHKIVDTLFSRFGVCFSEKPYSENYKNRRVLWYCWGGVGKTSSENVYNCLRRLRPRYLFEYYDGFRSFILSRLGKEPFSLKGILKPSKFVKDLIAQRLMTPDRYFMPHPQIWQRSTRRTMRAKAFYIPADVMKKNIMLVGGILNRLNKQEQQLKSSLGVVLTTGLFTERQRDIAFVDEMRMYEDILKTIRLISKKVHVLVKTHPRTSNKKMLSLRILCSHYKAQLDDRQQLIEYILEKSEIRRAVVIGTPTTALLNTLTFGYGTALCLSYDFMVTYLGDGYAKGYRLAAEDHGMMAEAGVLMLSSLTQLAELMEAQKLRWLQ